MSSARGLRLASRASELALWQARRVAALVTSEPGAPPVELVTIRTEGDRILHRPLAAVAGKSFFTKEIEEALTTGRADLAVHSLKDLATELPHGLILAAVLEREDARDALVVRGPAGGDGAGLERLPPRARVGTSSLRRRAFLARLRPDLEVVDLRGNVPTRLARLDEGRYEAVVLAVAGLRRLGLADRIAAPLPPDRMPPAVAQGALAVEARTEDEAVLRWLRPLDHPATRAATAAERALLRRLDGGCQVPVGALAEPLEDGLRLAAAVASLDGRQVVEGSLLLPGPDALERAEELGAALAEDLLARGAGAILAEIRGAQAAGVLEEGP